MTLLPNLLIVGAAKCGTTSLHQILGSHPAIEMSQPKELDIFSRPDWEDRLERYIGQYSGHSIIRGEGTPAYLHDPQGPEKMIRSCGADLKVICLLRHPTDRAYSHFWHSIRKGREFLPFEAALEMERERLEGDYEDWRSYSYLTRGFYELYLDRYRQTFGDDRLLVLSFADLVSDQVGVAHRVFEFLGADPDTWQPGEPVKANPARVPRSLKVNRVVKRALLTPFRPPARVINRLNMRVTKYSPIDQSVQSQLDDHFEASISVVGAEYGIDLNRGRAMNTATPSRLDLAGPETPCWALPEVL